jgi:hypothetical protein
MSLRTILLDQNQRERAGGLTGVGSSGSGASTPAQILADVSVSLASHRRSFGGIHILCLAQSLVFVCMSRLPVDRVCLKVEDGAGWRKARRVPVVMV